MNTKADKIKVNSVVQINETFTKVGWVGCYMHVTEVNPWGVMGFVPIVVDIDKPANQAYLRAAWDQIDYIGQAALVPSKEET